MADLWYPTADGDDRRWHLPVVMAPEGLRTMLTVCGRKAIALGEGLPFGKLPPNEQCYVCMFKHGDQLADRRETEQPARIEALAKRFAAGLGAALEGTELEERRIEGPPQ